MPSLTVLTSWPFCKKLNNPSPYLSGCELWMKAQPRSQGLSSYRPWGEGGESLGTRLNENYEEVAKLVCAFRWISDIFVYLIWLAEMNSAWALPAKYPAITLWAQTIVLPITGARAVVSDISIIATLRTSWKTASTFTVPYTTLHPFLLIVWARAVI